MRDPSITHIFLCFLFFKRRFPNKDEITSGSKISIKEDKISSDEIIKDLIDGYVKSRFNVYIYQDYSLEKKIEYCAATLFNDLINYPKLVIRLLDIEDCFEETKNINKRALVYIDDLTYKKKNEYYKKLGRLIDRFFYKILEETNRDLKINYHRLFGMELHKLIHETLKQK